MMTISDPFARRQPGMARALAAESVLDLYDVLHFARQGRVTGETWKRIRGVSSSSVTATFARTRRFLAENGVSLSLIRDKLDESNASGRGSGANAPGHFEFDFGELESFVAQHVDRATEIIERYRAKKQLTYERLRPPGTAPTGGGEDVAGENDEEFDEDEIAESSDDDGEHDGSNNEDGLADEGDEGGIFGCEICEYTTMKREDLAEHRRSCVSVEAEVAEPEQPRFECDECDFAAKTEFALAGHSKKHKREKRELKTEKRRLARQSTVERGPAATSSPRTSSLEPLTALRSALDALPQNARRPALELLLALETSAQV